MDTLKVYTALREPLGDRAAQAIADTLAGVATEQTAQLATKTDLELTKAELRQEMAELRQEVQAVKADLQREIQTSKTELDQKIQAVKADLQREIQTGKIDLIKWMVGLMLAQIFATVSLIKLLQ